MKRLLLLPILLFCGPVFGMESDDLKSLGVSSNDICNEQGLIQLDRIKLPSNMKNMSLKEVTQSKDEMAQLVPRMRNAIKKDLLMLTEDPQSNMYVIEQMTEKVIAYDIYRLCTLEYPLWTALWIDTDNKQLAALLKLTNEAILARREYMKNHNGIMPDYETVLKQQALEKIRELRSLSRSSQSSQASEPGFFDKTKAKIKGFINSKLGLGSIAEE